MNGFTCTYPPSSGECPVYKWFMNKGEQYDVLVTSHGGCSTAAVEYKIMVDAPFDPALTLVADDARRWTTLHVQVDGSATIP